MKTKRGNSEGSITKRPDGRWEARISLSDGRRKSFYGKTRQDVARRLAEAIRDRDKGLPVVGERQTLQHYLMDWLTMIEPTVDVRTYIRYESLVRLHILPALGDIPLARLTPQQVQALYSQKLVEGLSRATVVMIHAVLHRALEAAVRMDLVVRNVTERADVPRKLRTKMKVLSSEQIDLFFQAAAGSRFEALFVLALTTGMRQGELLALTWNDIDLEGASLQVHTTLKKVRRTFVFSAPKTEQSKRRIALTVFAVDALRRHQSKQSEERLRCGALWQDHDLVFPNAIGKPADRIDLVRRDFHRVLQIASLPPMRFHDLRHSAATLLLRLGVHPKVVSEMLGHSQIGITLDTYSHVLPDMQHQAVTALDRLFGRRNVAEWPHETP